MQEENHTIENFSSRLRDELESRNVRTPSELSKFAEVGWSTAKQWIDGSIPRKHALDALASRLGVTSTWLMTGEGVKDAVNTKEVDAILQEKAEIQSLKDNALHDSLIQIPVISWAHAGEAMAYEEMPHDYLEPMTVPRKTISNYQAFGLIVDGDSMEPVINHGDTVALMIDCPPRNGCIVVAKFKHDEGVMVRRYQILSAPSGKPERVKLLPYNTFYDATEHHISEFEWIIPVAALARQLW